MPITTIHLFQRSGGSNPVSVDAYDSNGLLAFAWMGCRDDIYVSDALDRPARLVGEAHALLDGILDGLASLACMRGVL